MLPEEAQEWYENPQRDPEFQKQRSPRTARLCVQIDPNLLKRVRVASAQSGERVCAFVERCLIDGLNEADIQACIALRSALNPRPRKDWDDDQLAATKDEPKSAHELLYRYGKDADSIVDTFADATEVGP